MSERRKRKVLLYEPIHDDAVRMLSDVAEIRYADGHTQDALIETARGVDGIIARIHGRVSAEVMDAAPQLAVIGSHGVGVDNIDVAAATERGIYVVNTPGANTNSVAEHGVGMMIALSKNFVALDQATREGRWEARYDYTGSELRGTTLGLVGFGRIGQRVASICREAFGMQILYADVVPHAEAAQALQARWVGLEALLSASDYVSLHVPLTRETRHLIGSEELNRMKPTAYLLNLARGAIVDEEALTEALRAGSIAGAGVDVFAEEPPSDDHPLLDLEKVLVSPHSAALTHQGLRRMAMVVEDVMRVWAGERPYHWVNEWEA